MRHIISLLMENESGALSRVSGLFSARGYNIESLTVAPTEDPTLSRMTIVTSGSDEIIEQIIKQLNKLIDVVKCRADRCCLERIMGVLFFLEYPQLSNQYSILGDIYSYTTWGYTYKQHCENTQKKIINRLPVIKVWSGR